MNDSVIFSRLLLEGWTAADLEPIFSARGMQKEEMGQELTYVKPPSAPIVASKPQRSVSRTLVVAGLVVVGSIAAAVYMYIKPPVVYSISLASGTATSGPMLTYGALPALSDRDFYEETKKRLADQSVSFVDADLSAMRLTVYTDGKKALEVPILSKGRPGSWWETPAGIYEIQTKERNHFSSFGQVYQPFSMAFQGNFFIHGWPYYEGGEEVPPSYSGGCIRLSTADAEKVFALAAVGMPVVVYSAESESDNFKYQLKAPAVSAKQYLVADALNGTVLTSKLPEQPTQIASITKLVTALIATEYINLDKEITVPSSALVYTSVPRLKAGSSARAYDLLFLLLQESSNEAAEVLASSVGRGNFVAYMNAKARSINLTHTLFADPSGAKNDLSTPEDLFTLLRYIKDNRSFVFDITAGTLKNSAYGQPAFKNINNFNLIPRAAGTLLGGKIGQTNQAGETYAGVFRVTVGSEEREIAIIVLDSKDAIADVQKLLTFVKTQYAPAEIN